MRLSRTAAWLLVWAVLSAIGGAGLAWALFDPAPSAVRGWFTPGPMTHGHHSIELACDACHTRPFGGGEVLQNACVKCHGAQLKAQEDSHPKTKFTDPRNADLLAKLDGRKCVSCHVEHRPELTGTMGLTMPKDYCITCHSKIGEDRPTHRGLAFDTCANAGCHNFHDNRALYEDFLLAHVHEPAQLAQPWLPAITAGEHWLAAHPHIAATVADHAAAPTVERDWLETAHAKAGVNCSGCHAAKGNSWNDHPDQTACSGCHRHEVDGFLAGMHGMRLAVGLSPMTPAMAQLPMREDSAHKQLSCTSCHAAHRFDTRRAAVDSCLACHNDQHSLAYRRSRHYALWQQEMAGQLPPGSGVSCASCHMPRVVVESEFGDKQILVEHNQNATLRPNEAMLRPSCLQCHGLQFALDALADPAEIASNFSTAPTMHVQSIDMALRHLAADRARRAQHPADQATPSR